MSLRAALAALLGLAVLAFAACASASDPVDPADPDAPPAVPVLLEAPECGRGPHRITVSEPGECPDACSRSMVRRPEGGYYAGTTTCTLAICYSEHEETWTDWPECEGARPLGPDPD